MVKVFVCVFADEEHRLISALGPVDHRSSLIPTEESIHPVFLSFERLVERGAFEGFLDNRRVVWHGADVIRFRNTGIEVLPDAPEIYRNDAVQNFFIAMRRIYRSQLRSMCQLRKRV